MTSAAAFDGVVLAGGAASRLGGVDKAAVQISGRTLLDRALAAVAESANRIVVGPARTLPAGVLSACEEPPGGGPVPGIAAGLTQVTSDLVVVLACDMPLVTANVVRELVNRASAGSGVGALLVDELGRRQPLAAAYRAEPLRAALAALPTLRNASVRALIAALRLEELPAAAGAALDCDTWESVNQIRSRLEET